MKHSIILTFLCFLSISFIVESKITSKHVHKQETAELNEQEKEEEMIKNIFPALGFEIGFGPVWNIVCITSDWGDIPGKLNIHGRAFFTYKYSVYHCKSYFKVNGIMRLNKGVIPENCFSKGKQYDNNSNIYSTIAISQYGNIPGKASTPRVSVFSHQGIRFTSKDFYWIC